MRIASQKFRILSFMKQQQTNTTFPVFPKSSWSFCAGTYQSHFLMHCAFAKDWNMQICSWKCSTHVWKTRSKKSFSEVSWREHRIREAASRIIFGIRVPFGKMFHVQGNAWPSLLIAPLQNSLQWKGDISKRLKKRTMKSGLSSPLMRKVTLA